MEAYDKLKKLVDEAAPDVTKTEDGNRAAGTRVRVKMQEIKLAAQAVRLAIGPARLRKAAGE